MKRIVVGSMNPVKIAAALQGFESAFPNRAFSARGCAVVSNVSDQPMSDAETLLGATNRARALRQTENDGDYFVGIEGGIAAIDNELFASAWIVVLARDGSVGRGRSGSFALPPKVKQLVESGLELGLANDQVFGITNSKHAGGAVGSLTGGVISRQALYEHAMVLALAAFQLPQLYSNS